MADTRTISELLQAPTEGYEDAIVLPPILAENFEFKVGLLTLVTSSQIHGFEREDPHSHIRWFNKITSTLKYKSVPHKAIKLMLFPFSLEGTTRIWLEKDPLRFDETFIEAWDRFKDLLRRCPHHDFLKLHQIDTFYNALTQFDQDSLNVAADGNLLNRTPRDALTIIENKSKVRTSRNKPVVSKASVTTSSSIPAYLPEITALTDAVKAMLIQNKTPSLALVKAIEEIYVTCGELDVAPKPNPKPSIPYPSRLNDQKLGEKANNQMLKFLQIFQRLHFNLSFADALLYMPKFASMLKCLLSNKEKLFELANTPLNENCSTVLLKKFPEKLGDLDKFLIPCDFQS
nr:reverse transcriptase domain-containing protein [Tanacetum cinerariifolium]